MSNPYDFKSLPLITTPIGTLVFPQIQTSTINYKFNKKDGSYNCSVAFSPEEARPIAEAIIKLRDEFQAFQQNELGQEILQAVLPYEKEKDRNGEETGNILFKTGANTQGFNPKTRESWDTPVPIFDQFGEPFDDQNGKVKIGSGSKGRMTVRLKPWVRQDDPTPEQKANNIEPPYRCGVRLVIEGVQLAKLVEFGGSVNAEGLGFTPLEEKPEPDPNGPAAAGGGNPIPSSSSPVDF